MNSSAVLRRTRAEWQGWIPTWDRSEFWPQKHWLWWSWDYLPSPAAQSVGRQVDSLRTGQVGVARTGGTPGDREDDTPGGFSRQWTRAWR